MADLRSTRDDLLTRVTHQMRIGGRLPDVREAEKIVDPIIAKVEHAQSRPRPTAAPAPRERGRKTPAGYRVTSDYGGTYRMSGNRLIPTEGTHVPRPRPPESRKAQAVRGRFRALRALPEWRAWIERILFSTMPAGWKQERLWEVYAKSCRVLGDPMAPRQRRIQVGAR